MTKKIRDSVQLDCINEPAFSHLNMYYDIVIDYTLTEKKIGCFLYYYFL